MYFIKCFSLNLGGSPNIYLFLSITNSINIVVPIRYFILII